MTATPPSYQSGPPQGQYGPQYGAPYGYGYAPMPAPPPPPRYDGRPRLDQLMARMRAHDDRGWGWRPAVVPCVTLLVLIIASIAFSHVYRPHTLTIALVSSLVLSAVLYGTLVASVVRVGRPLVQRYSGWGWTFGLQRPRWMDGAWLAAGVGMVLGGRLVVVLIANAFSHGRAVDESRNLTAHDLSPAGYLVLGIVVVGIAPIVEELVFRGLLLRTMMWHWGFWPAALVSSAVFALFHVYEVNTLVGAATLASVIFTLGLTNCLLVRWSGRLAAGMMVHAFFNGLAVVVLAVQG